MPVFKSIRNSSMVEKRDGIAWAIVLKETGKQIGDISFWRLIKEHYRAEIGG
jgi:RimJ/RimL family protein N-acetyltransferase